MCLFANLEHSFFANFKQVGINGYFASFEHVKIDSYFSNFEQVRDGYFVQVNIDG